MSERGKIDRLPFLLREQVCERLRDGWTAVKICEWLNALPEVLAVLDEHFHEQPISPQNLTSYRAGGFQKWMRRHERLDETRALSKHAVEMTTASGGKVADGASQILASEILMLLEDLEEAKFAPEGETPEAKNIRLGVIADSYDSISLALNRLRKGDQTAEVLRQREKQIQQVDKRIEMEREKFKESLRSKLEAGLDQLAEELKGNPQALEFYQRARALVTTETK